MSYFQVQIDLALRDVVRRTAMSAIQEIDAFCYIDISGWGGDLMTIIAKGGAMFFDLAGRTIDAALLEQLHNEVTAWFTAIKEGVSA